MSACNDLIGLAYGWSHRPGDGSGKTDCFQLVCEVRRRLGLKDYAPEFDWVYRQYAPETVPAIRLVRWLLQHSTASVGQQPGDVAVLPGTAAAAFATVSDVGGLVYINSRGRVIHAPTVPSNLKLYRPLT